MNFIKKNRVVFLLYLIVTLFFIYQHYKSISWDFSVYVLNAKYWLGDINYFEPFRPPLMPTILLVLSIFTWKIAEYLYIILISTLFFISSIKLSKALKINLLFFYSTSITIYSLHFGLINGTELASVAFLELGIAALLTNSQNGHWFALASLVRYNLIPIGILILLNKNIKKIAINIFLFSLLFIPWLLYNYYKYENLFLSIADIYAQNVLWRSYIHQRFNLEHIAFALNFLTPLFIFGIIIFIKKSMHHFNFKKYTAELIMLFLFIFTIYSYSNIPIKDVRYLFIIILPIAFFSTKALECIKKNIANYIVAILLILTLITSFAIPIESKPYKQAVEKIKELNINCDARSNAWPFMNYYGLETDEYSRQELLNYSINKGEINIFFLNTKEPEYIFNKTFISRFPILVKEKNFIILGNIDCKKTDKKLDKPYTVKVNETITLMYGEGIDIEPCNILFKSKTLISICNFINLK